MNHNMMKYLKSLAGILVVASVVLTLMIVRNSRSRTWPGDAGEAAAMIARRVPFLPAGSVDAANGDIVLLQLGDVIPDSLTAAFPAERVTLPGLADPVLAERLMAGNQKWVIDAADPALAVKGWVILTQAGVKNLYILERGDGEVLKQRFLPDTTVGPEPLDRDPMAADE